MEIRDNELALLQTMAGVTSEGALPPKLVDSYWRYKRLQCRVGHAGINLDALVLIGFLAGLGEAIPQDKPLETPLDKFKAAGVAKGDRIRVKFRAQEVEATFQSIDANQKLVVKFDDKMNPYRLKADDFVGKVSA